MIDNKGYRLNVGIILMNGDGNVFWGRRAGKKGWQFPQGGLDNYETVEEAMYRELGEELGLTVNDVKVLGVTRPWLYYQLPYNFRRHHQKPLCIGQKQKWYLLRLLSDDASIHFDQTSVPEFDQWQWVDYWSPVDKVITFKRDVYKQALGELSVYY